jgi:hypothetical protein
MADNPGIAFSDAFAKQQQLGINDRAQRATEQQQQFEQDAARKAEAERHIAQLLTVASNITKAASEAGNNPMTIAGSIQPLGDTAAQIANDTYGPDGGARVQRMFQALLARPPLEDKTSKKQFVTVPGGPFEGSTGYTFDTGTGTLSAPLTGPGKQSKNLTAPETTITGISVDGQPTETPP